MGLSLRGVPEGESGLFTLNRWKMNPALRWNGSPRGGAPRAKSGLISEI
jgi:hypothetical protein